MSAQPEIDHEPLFTPEQLQPHPSLGMFHLQHERAIVRVLNSFRQPQEEAITITNDRPVERVNAFLGETVTRKLADGTLRAKRRELVPKHDVVDAYRQQDSLLNTVFSEYEITAGSLRKRDDTPEFTEAAITRTMFATICMIDERGVKDVIKQRARAIDTINR